MSQEMAAKRKSRLKHKQEGILNQLTVVVYGALSHVVEEHPVPNQHVKRAYRQNQALWAREMKTGNPLPAVRKSPKTHLGAHKSAHVDAVKQSKNNRHDNHRHGNGEYRREQRDEPKM